MTKEKKNEKKSIQVKTGDRVVVLAGKDKGKIGNVKKVMVSEGKVIVEGINMITRAVKPNPMAGIQGGLVKMEAPLDASNVMLYCSACEKATRVKYSVVNDKKVRVCKKCNEQIDV